MLSTARAAVVARAVGAHTQTQHSRARALAFRPSPKLFFSLSPKVKRIIQAINDALSARADQMDRVVLRRHAHQLAEHCKSGERETARCDAPSRWSSFVRARRNNNTTTRLTL